MSTSATTAAKAGNLTATLVKGLDVLEALADVEEIGLSALARRIGVSVPTLFRILATLAAQGYVQKTAASRYRLTLKPWELGARVARRLTVREVAHPHMERLVAETGEAAHLAVLQGTGVVIIDKVDCAQAVRVDTYVGQRAPAHCAASGKAMLAFEPPATLDAILAEALPRFTAHTICDRARLEAELARVRARGHALNRGEWRLGVCAVAVPIRDHADAVVASLSLTMPTERFSDAALRRFLPALTRAGAAVARDLGRRESA
jgi:DNA-binding IclR family transcriptional regulator